jgi:5-methylcytosine-specific restriction endonuclease McrA
MKEMHPVLHRILRYVNGIEDEEADLYYVKKHTEEALEKLTKIDRSELDDVDILLLGKHLYWTVDTDEIYAARVLDVHPSKITSIIGPTSVWKICSECGCRIEFSVWSRQERDAKTEQEFVLCPECSEQIKEHSNSITGKAWAEFKKRGEAWEKHVRSIPYSEYLKTDHWQELRKHKLRNAYFVCELCGASDRILHVHHKTYESLGNEALGDLIVLCEDCHGRYHGIERPDSD